MHVPVMTGMCAGAGQGLALLHRGPVSGADWDQCHCVSTPPLLLSPPARCRASLSYLLSAHSYTVDISLWRPGCTGHWAGPLTTPPPLHTFPRLHSWARTWTLLATVEISAHILHNEWHSGPRAMIRGSKCNLTQIVNSVVRRES